MGNGKRAFVTALPTRYAFGSTEFHVLRPRQSLMGSSFAPHVKKMLSIIVGEMTRREIHKELELKDKERSS
jgi:hypothetical protein